MNTQTARFSTLRTLLKPTEFLTPSATIMVTMIAITRARRSGYDSSPFPRWRRHELILSRGKKGHANSQHPVRAFALSSGKGDQFVMREEKQVCAGMCVHTCACVQVCVSVCTCAYTVVHKSLFANGKFLVYRLPGPKICLHDMAMTLPPMEPWQRTFEVRTVLRHSWCIYGFNMLFENWFIFTVVHFIVHKFSIPF